MRPMSWRYKTEKKSCCSETLQCVHGKLAGASSSLIYDHYVDDIRTSTQLFSPMLMWISVCVAGSSKTRCFRILPRRKQNLGTRAQRDEILIASGEPSCFATLSRLTTNSTAPCWRTSTSLNLYHDLDISSFDLKHARSVTRINWRIPPPPAGYYRQASTVNPSLNLYHSRASQHIRPLTTLNFAKTIGNTVTSRLDYANALLHGTSTNNQVADDT